MKKILIIEAALFVGFLSLINVNDNLGTLCFVLFVAIPVIYLLMKLFKKLEIKPDFRTNTWVSTKAPERPKNYMKSIWLVESEEAEHFFKAYKQDLIENEDYFASAKDLKEEYDDEKVFMYNPYVLPHKIENERDVYSYIDKDEWILIGKIKKKDIEDIHRSLETTLYLYPNIYKYVTEDNVEKVTDEHYFGFRVLLPITEHTEQI